MAVKTRQEKLQYIQYYYMNDWLTTKQNMENELSDQQGMFCCCGKLATGLHEAHCKRFQNKVITATLKELDHLFKQPLMCKDHPSIDVSTKGYCKKCADDNLRDNQV